MPFSWGDDKKFCFEPYDLTEFDIWGKEVCAPDGSLVTYGGGLIKVKFKLLWVRNEKAPHDFGFEEFQKDWKIAQGLSAHGQMVVSVYSPKDEAYIETTCVPRWPDPSGKFYGPWLREFELFLDTPGIPEDYVKGPLVIPLFEPEVLTPENQPGGMGVGGFGLGKFGNGEFDLVP